VLMEKQKNARRIAREESYLQDSPIDPLRRCCQTEQ